MSGSRSLKSVARRFPYGIAILMALLLLGVATLELATSGTALAASNRIIAKGALPNVPDGEFIFRAVDLTLEVGPPAVTHVHGAGMVYSLEGAQVFEIGGQATTLSPGQGAWVSSQITHTHATNGKVATHFLFIFPLFPAAQKGTPANATPWSKASIPFDSDVLTFSNRQAQDVILAESAYQAGENGAQAFAGPTMLRVQDGKFTVTSGSDTRTVQAGDYWAVQANTPVRVRADASSGGRIVTLSIVPVGQPPLLPQTGGELERPWAMVGLLGLMLLGLGLALRRRYLPG